MKVLSVVLSFCLVFNFPVPFIYNSMMFALVVAAVYYIAVEPNGFKEMQRLFKKKHVLFFILIILLLIPLDILNGLYHFTFDFGPLKGHILLFILLLASIAIYPILRKSFKNNDSFNSIIDLLISVFIIQSIIQILAFVFPAVLEVTKLFKKDVVASKDMGGIRALALSGNPFFDLAAGYGLVFILFIKRKLLYPAVKGSSLINIIIFVLLFVGSFFAGRTAFVGLALGLLLYIFSLAKNMTKIKVMGKYCLVIFMMAITFYTLIPSEIKMVIDESLLPFAFEFIYSYQETGSLTTESSEVLEKMYFPIGWWTFLIGDGLYNNEDGSYYLHTDAGYMRNMLYYGFLGSSYIVIGQLYVFRQVFQILVHKLKMVLTKSLLNDLFFFITVILFMFSLQYKGEILLFMPIIQIMVIWLIIAYNEANYNPCFTTD